MERLSFVLELGLVLSLWVLLVQVYWHQGRTKRAQDELLQARQAELGARRWFRVNVSRPAAFRRVFKVLPFEGTGLLIDEEQQLRLVAVLRGGEHLERVVPKTPENLSWLGNAGPNAVHICWISFGHGDDAVMICADTGLNAHPSREASADLFRALLPGQPLPASALGGFALEKNRAALTVALIFVAVLCLSLLDLGLSEHELLSPPGVYLATGSLGLVGLLVWPVLMRARVPCGESVVLALLLSAALAGGASRLALRLDQWLAGGAVAIEYRLEGGARLVPVTPGPPAVSLPHVREYWDQFDAGTVHTLDIVHGPLGLWQLDRTRLNAATHAWYAQDRSKAASATER